MLAVLGAGNGRYWSYWGYWEREWQILGVLGAEVTAHGCTGSWEGQVLVILGALGMEVAGEGHTGSWECRYWGCWECRYWEYWEWK